MHSPSRIPMLICKKHVRVCVWRYAEAGASLIPFALEAGGRPSDEAAAFVRLMGSVYTETHGSEDGEPAPSPVGRLWQELSTLLQRGNAELILSAIGR